MNYRLSDDEREEFRPNKSRYTQCSDGFCGAIDCPRCSPERFRCGVSIEDIQAAEELAQERGEEAAAADEAAESR